MRNCACYIVPCKHMNLGIIVPETYARSLVDDRQPFFKQNGELLTVKQKMSQKAH